MGEAARHWTELQPGSFRRRRNWLLSEKARTTLHNLSRTLLLTAKTWTSHTHKHLLSLFSLTYQNAFLLQTGNVLCRLFLELTILTYNSLTRYRVTVMWLLLFCFLFQVEKKKLASLHVLVATISGDCMSFHFCVLHFFVFLYFKVWLKWGKFFCKIWKTSSLDCWFSSTARLQRCWCFLKIDKLKRRDK